MLALLCLQEPEPREWAEELGTPEHSQDFAGSWGMGPMRQLESPPQVPQECGNSCDKLHGQRGSERAPCLTGSGPSRRFPNLGRNGECVGCPLAARPQPCPSVPAAHAGAHVSLLLRSTRPPASRANSGQTTLLLPWGGQSSYPLGSLPRAANSRSSRLRGCKITPSPQSHAPFCSMWVHAHILLWSACMDAALG